MIVLAKLSFETNFNTVPKNPELKLKLSSDARDLVAKRWQQVKAVIQIRLGALCYRPFLCSLLHKLDRINWRHKHVLKVTVDGKSYLKRPVVNLILVIVLVRVFLIFDRGSPSFCNLLCSESTW